VLAVVKENDVSLMSEETTASFVIYIRRATFWPERKAL